ncbi:MAG: HD domain-containing phosphohydrolase [Myxococcaceae bacterium]
MRKPIGERLVDAGLITPDDVQKALQQQRITGHRLGDCLVEIGLMQEVSLLRFLATELKTRFVSTEKLSKAKITDQVLDRIPVRMAEAQMLLPVAYDAERSVLAVVMAEPQNNAILRELAVVAEVKEIYAYVGLRSGIVAGIKRNYYGDPTAFTSPGPSPRADLSALYQVNESISQVSRAPAWPGLERERPRSGTGSRRLHTSATRDTFFQSRTPESDFTETLNVLIGQLEMSRGALRGHSAQLARRAGFVARRLGMSPREVAYVAMAAQLHDLGKTHRRHLTLATCAASLDAKAEARRLFRTPIRLFERVHLPLQVNTILAQMYEAFDGSGVPQGAKGDDITLGARILAATDGYLDLTRNPANTHDRLFTKEEALTQLRTDAGRLYDPRVVEAIAQLQSGELVRQKLRNDGRQVTLCVSNTQHRSTLAHALSDLGIISTTLSRLEGALDALMAGETDLLVLGLDLGGPDISTFAQAVRAHPELAGTPLLVLGEPTDTTVHRRLLEHGINAYLPLPVEANAAATIRNFLADHIQHGAPAHPVSGSLDEVSLNELLTLCGIERKTGSLRFTHDDAEICLHVELGRILQARAGTESGDGALRELLQLDHAEFQFDPEAVLLETPTLDVPLEFLARS